MAYCTRAQVINAVGGVDRLRQLLDRDGDTVEDPNVLEDAIATADALIDSYAQKRFAVPFAAVTSTIGMLSARLTRYELRLQNSCLSSGDEKSYEQDLKWLDALSKGDVMPGGVTIAAPSPMVNDKSLPVSDFREVSRDRLKGFA